MTKKLFLPITIAFVLVLFCTGVFASPSRWAEPEVTAAKNIGLVPERIQSGYQNPITREEFCEMSVLLYKGITKKEAPASQSTFTDTDNPAVASAHALGIVNGVGDNLFAPASFITRQEICTMLTRAITASFPDIKHLDYPNTFPDIGSISDWALMSVKYINMLEIMLGDEHGRINPLENTTREQAILLAYRTKKAFDSGISGILEEYGLVSTGNTSSNMLNGAFAIHYRDGKLYVHDGSGIYIHSAGHIVNEPVDCMFIGENVIYYIKSSDKKLYSKALPAGAEKLLCQTAASGIVVSGGKIYFKGLDDSQIYSVPREGGTPEMVSDGAAAYGLPVSAGNQIIYASKDSIISYSTPYKTTSVLYSGDVSDLCFDNSILYFKNGEGKLCFIDISGKNYTEITKMAVKTFCVFQGKIAFTAEDGLYKTNKNGSFCIRIDDVIYDALNSYNDYIYAKTADGSIIKMKRDLSEKTAVN